MVRSEKIKWLIRKGHLLLLEIKDADIRLLTLQQAIDAVDKSIHMGGAASATIPLVALYYGGVMDFDVSQPTRRGQDMFILSKGHSVATLASVYADLGYFERSVLKNSRSRESILNGHPGPILPGIHISTGPLGQGLSVAEGLALIGKRSSTFDVFCMTGDGELQEGTIWEAVMFSGTKKLDNLCLLIDKNSGQLDDARQLLFPMLELGKRFSSFGWKVHTVDASQYGPVLEALEDFKFGCRNGRPTAIICRTRKGSGSCSTYMTGHKIDMPDTLARQEMSQLEQIRAERVADFFTFCERLDECGGDGSVRDQLIEMAKAMNLEIIPGKEGSGEIQPILLPLRTKPALPQKKQIKYDTTQLPRLERSKEYRAANVITQAMKVFAQDRRVVSVDADLALVSGLEEGVGFVDRTRAINAGIAEANMMGIGEAYAAMGYNTWISTFCPFFNWKVLRRIAIGYQERLEVMAHPGGWLTEGHGLDLTMVATAPNFETQTNGATHMGNDDVTVFAGIAHLKIIDISCPQQLLRAMQWVMAGNRGLVYMRVLRAPSAVIYGPDFTFEYGKGYVLKESPQDQAVIVSSGRQVYEALAAAAILEESGWKVGVVDMPSFDKKTMIRLYNSGKFVVLAEQNNGFLWAFCKDSLFQTQNSIDPSRLLPINCLDQNGQPQFIHSATYAELLDQFGLAPPQLVATIKKRLQTKNRR